jgi:hypothetical protein
MGCNNNMAELPADKTRLCRHIERQLFDAAQAPLGA